MLQSEGLQSPLHRRRKRQFTSQAGGLRTGSLQCWGPQFAAYSRRPTDEETGNPHPRLGAYSLGACNVESYNLRPTVASPPTRKLAIRTPGWWPTVWEPTMWKRTERGLTLGSPTITAPPMRKLAIRTPVIWKSYGGSSKVKVV
jgi:hypothetical protein